ncbi:hypothetical protein [Pseudomonas costantinii]|uniref:hypothetical protein n=1 Tax=Pseudomonas costantinii TaxID=168469 RepID=UPI0015A3ACA3|nr:hypothetical protein [Pseudomonas costantinii]NVZ71652.1 hypothetical protein [Pseudomonas costantinii]
MANLARGQDEGHEVIEHTGTWVFRIFSIMARAIVVHIDIAFSSYAISVKRRYLSGDLLQVDAAHLEGIQA